MIEIRRRSRLARAILSVSRIMPLPVRMRLFVFGMGRLVCKYRIRGGAWQSFKSAPQNYAIRLFAGEELTE